MEPQRVDGDPRQEVGVMAGESLTGLDLDALTAWLDRVHPGLRAGALSASRLTGGMSNLTYAVRDDEHRWALRRPPLGHALPTAHDMSREFRIISGLHGTDVPVAEPVVLCEDADVLGAPFYLMGYVDGVVLDRREVLAGVTVEQAQRASELLVSTLLDIHALDPADVGLADLGRPDGFLERQLRRWGRQWDASETEPRSQQVELKARLEASVPAQSAAGLVHGDYRLTNVMYAPDLDSVAAVVDWEMATVGDPLADVGLLVVYQTLGNLGGSLMPRLTVEQGFDSADQVVARYAAGSPRDLSALPWYVAFGWFKLAVIAEGIHRRFVNGQTVGDGFDRVGAFVPGLLDAGLAALGPRTSP